MLDQLEGYAAEYNAQIIAFEYPGYGGTPALADKNQVQNLYLSTEAGWDYMVSTMNINAEAGYNIFLIGYSIGSVAMTDLYQKKAHSCISGMILYASLASALSTLLLKGEEKSYRYRCGKRLLNALSGLDFSRNKQKVIRLHGEKPKFNDHVNENSKDTNEPGTMTDPI